MSDEYDDLNNTDVKPAVEYAYFGSLKRHDRVVINTSLKNYVDKETLKRYLIALREEIGQGGGGSGSGDLETRLNNLAFRVDGHEGVINNIQNKQRDIDAILAILTTKVDTNELDISILKQQMEENNIKHIEIVQKFEENDARHAELVNKDAEHDAALAALSGKDAQQDAALAALSGKDAQQDATIAALSGKDSQQDAVMASLAEQLRSMNEKLSRIEENGVPSSGGSTGGSCCANMQVLMGGTSTEVRDEITE